MGVLLLQLLPFISRVSLLLPDFIQLVLVLLVILLRVVFNVYNRRLHFHCLLLLFLLLLNLDFFAFFELQIWVNCSRLVVRVADHSLSAAD